MIEEWKDVVDYEDYFKISNFGRVFSKRSGKILSPGSSGDYYSISTRLHGRKSKSICLKIHRMVAKTFLDKDENRHYVNHIDGNKLNNRVDNLEWVTPSENIKHAFKNDLLKSNKLYRKTTKLNWELVRNLRKYRIDNPKEKIQDIINRFDLDISTSTLKSVFLNTTWKE